MFHFKSRAGSLSISIFAIIFEAKLSRNEQKYNPILKYFSDLQNSDLGRMLENPYWYSFIHYEVFRGLPTNRKIHDF